MQTRGEQSAVRAKRRRRMILGPFEARVMEVLWRGSEHTVHEVKRKLSRKRAYTTVMTTMARLYEKGVLSRRKRGHQFVYKPRLSAQAWGRLAASEFVDNFISVPNVSHKLLISSLLDALGELDPKLPAEMQAQIRQKGAQRTEADLAWDRRRRLSSTAGTNTLA